VYRIFGIEARFGFNRTDLRTLFPDRLKSAFLPVILDGPLLSGVLLFLLGIVIFDSKLFEAFYVNHESTCAGLVFFSILSGRSIFLIGMAVHWISRRQEYPADRFAARTTGDSRSLTDALKKLSMDSLSHQEPHEFYVALSYFQPPGAVPHSGAWAHGNFRA